MIKKINLFSLKDFFYSEINKKSGIYGGLESGAASGIGSPVSRSPGPGNLEQGTGLILKAGTHIHNMRDLRLGLKFEKSGPRTGTRTQNQKIWDRGLGPGLRFAGRGFPGLNFGRLSRGLKIFRDTVVVPCRSLFRIGENENSEEIPKSKLQKF